MATHFKKKVTRGTDSRFGNWHYPNTWSQQARNIKAFETVKGLGTDGNDPLAVGLVEYFGDNNFQIQNLANALANEVFCLKRLPQQKGDEVRIELAPELGNDLRKCLERYGHLSVLFSDGTEPFPEEVWRADKNIRIKEDLFLVDVRNLSVHYGMPVKEFLLRYGGTEHPDKFYRGVIMEWSGIPTRRQGWVYHRIVELFGRFLDDERKFEAKYGGANDGGSGESPKNH